jgi:hypothetical protein
MSINSNAKVINIASVAANAFLILATIFLSIYIIIPLFGGKFYFNATIKYASWLGIALCLKIVLIRFKKNLRMRFFDYSAITLLLILNIAVWFKFPVSLFLSILFIIGLIISFIKLSEWNNNTNRKID